MAAPVTVAAILVAAGSGARLGAELPKAFCLVRGRTLVDHALARFVSHPAVRDVIVVVPTSHLDAVDAPGVRVVGGGATRQQSVNAGLAVLHPDVDFVLVHDVARPFVPAAVITRVVAALVDGADAVVPAVAVTDTIKRVDGVDHVVETLDRTELRSIQTPQGFRRDVLLAAHALDSPVTDDAALVELSGGTVLVVDGADESFKITRPSDLVLAEALPW